MKNQDHVVSLYAVGDVCVNRANPESIFALAAPLISEADIAFCQLESMYSERGSLSIGANVGLKGHPNNVSALTFAGFNIASLAGNHVMDFGPEGIMDTIDLLKRNNVHTVGAGKNIAEARKPVIIEQKGIRTAFLAYNSILTHNSYAAGTDNPGCAPIRAYTLYEPIEVGHPGCPARILTFADKDDLEAMKHDVMNAKGSADVVVISFHWGVHFTPATVTMYEREIAHAAIDAGADLILGTHAHILRAIELYKGKIITYCLGNFAFDLYWKAEDYETPRRKELLKYYPNRTFHKEYPTYHFPADSRKTIVFKCHISKDGVQRASFVPALINTRGQPEILRPEDKRSLEVFDYMNDLCKEFGTRLSWEDDEILIHTNDS